MSEEIIAVIEASPSRRVFAVGTQLGMGALLIYFALAIPNDFIWQAFLLIFGLAWIFLAVKMNSAARVRLELTETSLRDSHGEELASLENVRGVSRGMFAFKPSNGFALVLKQSKGPARWRPGLWWRLGTRVGVGGVTSGAQTKPAAQIIEAIIAQRMASETD